MERALGHLTVYLQHGPRAVEHCTSRGAEVLGRSSTVREGGVESSQQGWCGGIGRELYLSGGGLQGMQLVHGET